MKENKLLTIDQLLAKELIVFMFNFSERNYSMSEINKFCSNFLHFCSKLDACFYMKTLKTMNKFRKVIKLCYSKCEDKILW